MKEGVVLGKNCVENLYDWTLITERKEIYLIH